LEELSDREKLSKEGTDNLSTALRNVNALLRLTTATPLQTFTFSSLKLLITILLFSNI
jgi:hypothetical protein